MGLAAYGFFVISSADNVIKPIVLHGQSKLHPLLALLSVLGGIQGVDRSALSSVPCVSCFCRQS